MSSNISRRWRLSTPFEIKKINMLDTSVSDFEFKSNHKQAQYYTALNMFSARVMDKEKWMAVAIFSMTGTTCSSWSVIP